MTFLRKHIIRIGLLASLALPLSMLPQTQLSRLNNTGVLSSPVHQQLQQELAAGRIGSDTALFQQAETQMQQYEQLQPGAIAPRWLHC